MCMCECVVGVAFWQRTRGGPAARGLLVGNPPLGSAAFARTFDRLLPDIAYVNQQWDFVATPLLVPSRLYGYHPAGRPAPAPALAAARYPYATGPWRRGFPHLRYL
jgi:hypothetical protein